MNCSRSNKEFASDVATFRPDADDHRRSILSWRRLHEYLRRAYRIGLRMTCRRAVEKMVVTLWISTQRRRDFRIPTFTQACEGRVCPRIATDLTISPLGHEWLAEITQLILAHRFDLLGSGWIKVRHGMQCPGFENCQYDSGPTVKADAEGKWLEQRINTSNLQESQRIWRQIDVGYEPIDWQLDFKSGYRWSEHTWYQDIPIGHLPGVDVKVPWELGRLQHLPMLALAHLAAKNGPLPSKIKETCRREFHNQSLDFMATNPPRFGVNWRCTMDVAIRVANLVVAYDLFHHQGVEWDEQFDREFARSVYAHGQHIVDNLEWNQDICANHYLANLAGLAFVACYLPRTTTTNTWLLFSTAELLAEAEHQFHLEGTNFEASTSYHRLSAEMVVYTTALLSGATYDLSVASRDFALNSVPRRSRLAVTRLVKKLRGGKDVFDREYLDRIERMAEFSMHVTKPNGQIHLVGDNDSGRFLKLVPSYRRATGAGILPEQISVDGWREDHLDHRALVSAIHGLVEREDFALFSHGFEVETALVRALTKKSPPTHLKTVPSSSSALGDLQEEPIYCGGNDQALPFDINWDHYEYRFPLATTDVWRGATFHAYPAFGLYIWRSSRIYLAVRCGSVGQDNKGGHAHNDQLAIELQVDGRDLLVDPGTYVYTPFPNLRNCYRSVKTHSAPQTQSDCEPGSFGAGLFLLEDRSKAETIVVHRRMFLGRHFGYASLVYRQIEIHPREIIVRDAADRKTRLQRADWPPFSVAISSKVPVAVGYGLLAHGLSFASKTYENAA
jgi:hypothetical protein